MRISDWSSDVCSSDLTLNWHKWTGVVISLASALLIWYRQALFRGKEEDPSSGDNSARLRSNILRIGMGVVCLVLVIAGNLGASLTHGENFVSPPVTPDQSHPVDLSPAVFFTLLVFHLLYDKCFFFHNPANTPGNL